MSDDKDPDFGLDQQVASLSRDIQPQNDLWAAIEPELLTVKSRKPAQRRLVYLWASVASVLMIGALFMVNSLPPVGNEVAFEAEPPADIQVITVYEAAIAEQLHVLHIADSNWGDVHYQLQVFRSAVAEIRFALSFQPHNPDLLQQLQDVYQQQLAWLQAVSSYNSALLS